MVKKLSDLGIILTVLALFSFSCSKPDQTDAIVPEILLNYDSQSSNDPSYYSKSKDTSQVFTGYVESSPFESFTTVKYTNLTTGKSDSIRSFDGNFTFNINFSQGFNNISFAAINQNGDISADTITVFTDSRKPIVDSFFPSETDTIELLPIPPIDVDSSLRPLYEIDAQFQLKDSIPSLGFKWVVFSYQDSVDTLSETLISSIDSLTDTLYKTIRYNKTIFLNLSSHSDYIPFTVSFEDSVGNTDTITYKLPVRINLDN